MVIPLSSTNGKKGPPFTSRMSPGAALATALANARPLPVTGRIVWAGMAAMTVANAALKQSGLVVRDRSIDIMIGVALPLCSRGVFG